MYMKTLCLGGSFNPIHHGHLICARAVAEAAGFDRVLLVPSSRPPHKPDPSDLADPSHRLHMCRLAIAPQLSSLTSLTPPGASRQGPAIAFEVWDLEIRRPGPSYTIDTVRQLKTEFGWPKVHWLVGADMLNYLPKWHEAAALLRETEFVIMRRPGVSLDFSTLPADAAEALAKHVYDAPLIDISSTDIRRRVRAGESIDYLTPPAVVDYIRAESLYLPQPGTFKAAAP